MDIPHQRLVYFQVTVEAGSIRRAAARLNIAPSAVSRQIGLLEEAMAASLIERTRDGVQPTRVGEMLLDYILQREKLDQHLGERLDAYQRLETGEIRLIIGEGFVGDIINSPLRAFRKQYPGITLKVDTGSMQSIIDSVIEDEADIGLMYHERVHPQLRFWHSSPQPLVAIMSPEHPLASEAHALTLEEVSQHPMALWGPSHGVRQLMDDGFREAGVRPHMVVQTNSMEVLKQAARSELCITLLPAFASARELQEGVLIARDVECASFRQARAHIITRVGRRMPRASLQLLRHLERWIAAFSGPRQEAW
ncbi:LysR family transcriptional regulator [Cobetia amphilecti]|jgi:DNA-binding transcriptional LysR family regulator|uniref:LysR family transcriptional regulator n=1 Tax=Cobetia amphilecti TaxID=1055104 RepID=A0ABT6US58_9GAMM|nr:LysR family transcriptional regulator [Cobetia amphilecti]MDI5884908.1 LysR family transcriptional regulator [Cobetia amphilecti]TCJ26238.1 LysR family transcriptional regulator [Halomonas sp. GDM18]|tara:strand:- start:341 stop:1267 length:927 start_codon:yes stop_codon:yes gene_type:complete